MVENGQWNPIESGTLQGGVASPILANIVLNRLDWTLANNGFHSVRYADDVVVLCRESKHAEEALVLVQETLNDLGLSLSKEKTHITTFYQGFDFLGFHITCGRASIRAKSLSNFKAKVKKITRRSHNLDASVIERLNNLIRGTHAYFTPWFGTPWKQFRRLDHLIRKRIRAMKYKRLWNTDNWRFKNKYIKRLGLLSFMDFYTA